MKIKLFRSDQTGERLALNVAGIRIGNFFLQSGIKRIRFIPALFEYIVKIPERFRIWMFGQSENHRFRSAFRDCNFINGGGLGSCHFWVYGMGISIYQKIVKSIFKITFSLILPIQAINVCFVVAENQFGVVLEITEMSSKVR